MAEAELRRAPAGPSSGATLAAAEGAQAAAADGLSRDWRPAGVAADAAAVADGNMEYTSEGSSLTLKRTRRAVSAERRRRKSPATLRLRLRSGN